VIVRVGATAVCITDAAARERTVLTGVITL
jgi:hypothetical protein